MSLDGSYVRHSIESTVLGIFVTEAGPHSGANIVDDSAGARWRYIGDRIECGEYAINGGVEDEGGSELRESCDSPEREISGGSKTVA